MNTQQPRNGLGDYRTIGRVSPHSGHTLEVVSQGDNGDDDDR